MRKLDLFLTLMLFILLTNCSPKAVSTIIGGEYNSESNVTDYFVIPYGKVMIPGKWTKSNYNQNSKQQFFDNSDSVTIAIAFGPCNKFEFNFDKSKTGIDFVQSYYEWDSQYFKKQGFSTELIEKNDSSNYIIWKLTGQFQNQKIDNYYLFTESNCNVSNFSILTTEEWTRKEKIEFLKKLLIK